MFIVGPTFKISRNGGSAKTNEASPHSFQFTGDVRERVFLVYKQLLLNIRCRFLDGRKINQNLQENFTEYETWGIIKRHDAFNRREDLAASREIRDCACTLE
jgi:hypothetical protein